MKELVQITVKTKTMDLFRFMLFHAYSSLSGVITMIFGLGSLIMLPVTYFVWKDAFVSLILLMVVIIYVIVTPLNMLSQSKRQVISNPVFKNPITYHISDEIFEVQQYTGTVRLFWNQLFRIKKTPFDFLFYVNEQQAFVIPKKAMSEADNITLNQIIEKIGDQLPKQPTLIERLRGQTTSVANPVKEEQIKVHTVDKEEKEDDKA
ncbi:YcxB family protein [Vallitaleaceae bacterium 9-2]